MKTKANPSDSRTQKRPRRISIKPSDFQRWDGNAFRPVTPIKNKLQRDAKSGLSSETEKLNPPLRKDQTMPGENQSLPASPKKPWDEEMRWQVYGFQDAMKGSRTKPPWIIENLLLEESATLVSAHPHAMKSLSWLQACLEAVAKKRVWGHFAAPSVERALFIETEDPAWLVEARIRGIAKGMGLDPSQEVSGFRYVCPGPFKLAETEQKLGELMAKHRPNFAVVSTLQSILGDRDWKEQKDMQPVMATIIRLSRDCPIVLLTHSPWDKKERRAAGSVTQTANFLTTIHYQKSSNQKEGKTSVHVLTDSKVGTGHGDFHIDLRIEGDESDPESVRGVYYGGTGWPKGVGKEAVVAAIQDAPDAPADDIARLTGVSARYVRKIRKAQESK